MILLVKKFPNHGHGAKFRNLANFTTQRTLNLAAPRISKALNRAATLRIRIKLMLTTKALKSTVIDLVRNIKQLFVYVNNNRQEEILTKNYLFI